MRTVMSWPAISPIIRRVPVPELPKSSSPSGSAKPPTPRPSTSQVPAVFRIGHPSACSALAVFSTSSASSSPVMVVRRVAIAPNIRARCEMDLSPGTLIRPDRAGDRVDDNGLGLACDTALRGLNFQATAASRRRHGPP